MDGRKKKEKHKKNWSWSREKGEVKRKIRKILLNDFALSRFRCSLKLHTCARCWWLVAAHSLGERCDFFSFTFSFVNIFHFFSSFTLHPIPFHHCFLLKATTGRLRHWLRRFHRVELENFIFKLTNSFHSEKNSRVPPKKSFCSSWMCELRSTRRIRRVVKSAASIGKINPKVSVALSYQLETDKSHRLNQNQVVYC